MRTERHKTPYDTERVWLYAAVSLVVVSVSLYMYFVCASIHHVVMRKEVDQQISAQSSRVSELESSYIEAQHAVSADIASMHGFALAPHKIFIDRAEPTLVFSGN